MNGVLASSAAMQEERDRLHAELQEARKAMEIAQQREVGLQTSLSRVQHAEAALQAKVCVLGGWGRAGGVPSGPRRCGGVLPDDLIRLGWSTAIVGQLAELLKQRDRLVLLEEEQGQLQARCAGLFTEVRAGQDTGRGEAVALGCVVC
jgi:hypothetical protein